MSSRADFAEYAATRLIAGTLVGLPRGASASLGRAIGGLALTAGLRRSVAETQLAASFPDRDENWVVETVRACYRHFVR